MRPAPAPGRPLKDYTDTDTIPEADRALFSRRCLEMYARGMSPDAIALEEGVDRTLIWQVIREAAHEARESNRGYAEAVFVQQDLGLKLLIARAHDAVKRGADAGTPYLDKDAVRVLILLYERQARLLGIDRARPGNERDTNEWLRGATTEDLVKRAKILGIRIPESILPTTSTPA